MPRKNVELMAVKVAAMEEWLFNHPGPYDLTKIECLEKLSKLQSLRFSDQFDMAEFVKLDDPVAIIRNVDKVGPDPGSTLPKSEIEGITDQWRL